MNLSFFLSFFFFSLSLSPSRARARAFPHQNPHLSPSLTAKSMDSPIRIKQRLSPIWPDPAGALFVFGIVWHLHINLWTAASQSHSQIVRQCDAVFPKIGLVDEMQAWARFSPPPPPFSFPVASGHGTGTLPSLRKRTNSVLKEKLVHELSQPRPKYYVVLGVRICAQAPLVTSIPPLPALSCSSSSYLPNKLWRKNTQLHVSISCAVVSSE